LRICMIFEGCYPYVTGGVSSWAQQYIEGMPQHEFVLWTIGADSALRGKYKYTMPTNVKEIHEIFLDEALSIPVSCAGAALLEMCDDDLNALGEAGQRRAHTLYRHRAMIEKYASLYTEVCEKWQE
jgi:hypothetical protein